MQESKHFGDDIVVLRIDRFTGHATVVSNPPDLSLMISVDFQVGDFRSCDRCGHPFLAAASCFCTNCGVPRPETGPNSAAPSTIISSREIERLRSERDRLHLQLCESNRQIEEAKRDVARLEELFRLENTAVADKLYLQAFQAEKQWAAEKRQLENELCEAQAARLRKGSERQPASDRVQVEALPTWSKLVNECLTILQSSTSGSVP